MLEGEGGILDSRDWEGCFRRGVERVKVGGGIWAEGWEGCAA